jgi:hypothetical protein
MFMSACVVQYAMSPAMPLASEKQTIILLQVADILRRTRRRRKDLHQYLNTSLSSDYSIVLVSLLVEEKYIKVIDRQAKATSGWRSAAGRE